MDYSEITAKRLNQIFTEFDIDIHISPQTKFDNASDIAWAIFETLRNRNIINNELIGNIKAAMCSSTIQWDWKPILQSLSRYIYPRSR